MLLLVVPRKCRLWLGCRSTPVQCQFQASQKRGLTCCLILMTTGRSTHTFGIMSANVDLCPVCFDDIDFYAISSCEHPVSPCSRCVFRLRVLFEDTKCCLCKENNDKIVVTADKTRTLDSFEVSCINDVYG